MGGLCLPRGGAGRGGTSSVPRPVSARSSPCPCSGTTSTPTCLGRGGAPHDCRTRAGRRAGGDALSDEPVTSRTKLLLFIGGATAVGVGLC